MHNCNYLQRTIDSKEIVKESSKTLTVQREDGPMQDSTSEEGNATETNFPDPVYNCRVVHYRFGLR